VDQEKGSNIVKIGIDLKEFYHSVEWDILEVPATRNEEYYIPQSSNVANGIKEGDAEYAEIDEDDERAKGTLLTGNMIAYQDALGHTCDLLDI
jgi:hypothetical protein